MATAVVVSPADLLVDIQNPRIAIPNGSQRDALLALARNQQGRLVELANDILTYGPSPAELPIVMAVDDNSGRYIVLEGNRRLAAIKGLENPDTFAGALEARHLTRLRRLSRLYLAGQPIQQLACAQVANREEANHWLELKHGGAQGGAGIVAWRSDEAQRFIARADNSHQRSESAGFRLLAQRTKRPRRVV